MCLWIPVTACIFAAHGKKDWHPASCMLHDWLALVIDLDEIGGNTKKNQVGHRSTPHTPHNSSDHICFCQVPTWVEVVVGNWFLMVWLHSLKKTVSEKKVGSPSVHVAVRLGELKLHLFLADEILHMRMLYMTVGYLSILFLRELILMRYPAI